MFRTTMLIGASLIAALAPAAAASPTADLRARLPQDEVIYFLLPDRFENGDPSNDRGGLTGDRLHTGFDPTDKGFYHGGDLKGLTKRLDYIQELGATAIWVGADLQEQARAGPAGARIRRLSRLLDHRFHPASIRISAPTPISRRWSMPPMRAA